ncbi:MAG: hypothetical protein HY051_06165 [Candidatus Aenigmarchaeota archaeon]|nr:hypothetical protein [Candidatus Aenigmarchaeota archaeon]
MSEQERETIKKLLARALNKNQMLVLSEIHKNCGKSITSILLSLSRNEELPLSTLKLNSKVLKELGLVRSDLKKSLPKVSETGEWVLEIMGGGNP